MSAPEEALNILLLNISQQRTYNPSLTGDVKESMEKLQIELGYLKSVMRDFSKYKQDSNYVKEIFKEIRGIIGEADDAVDTYIVLAAAQKSRSWVSRAFHPKGLGDARDQIALVTEKVKKHNEGNIRNGFEVLQFQATVALQHGHTTQEAPKIEEEHVIGFDGPAKQVTELLVQGPQNLEVITIAGMIGVGKTTLANMVYKHPEVDNEFMIRAFVNISRQYDKKEVMLKILESFARVSEEVRMMTTEGVARHLYGELEGKQYLFILDDVCELKDWDSFKRVFPKNKKRCRVVLTTTNARLGEHANPRNPDSLYMLSLLSPEDSKLLLCRRVLGKEVFPEQLQPYVREITSKCGGLPLAILRIAGILVNEPNRVDWWSHVSENVSDYIGRGDKNNNVIAKMYEHLPDLLKACFLFLGVFPDDYDIPVWKLERLWISEGFIQVHEGFTEVHQSLENVAQRYLIELIHRNLVVVGQRKSNGKVKTCRLHSTLREFCRTEAAEGNLYREIQRKDLNYFLSQAPSLDNLRRLCINDESSVLEYISQPVSGKHVRSFLTFHKKVLKVVQQRSDPSLLKAFKLLKVLEAQSLIFTQLPPDLITNLVLLKYLAISSDITSIPSSFSRLWSLQTLIVSTTSPTLQIETELWKMPHFRHLHCNAPAFFPEPRTKIRQKSEAHVSENNVQTLCTMALESCRRDVLSQTKVLKKLGIRGSVAELFKTDGSAAKLIRNLEQLENLKLENNDIENKIDSLPRHVFPGQLTKLTLMNTELEWKEMSILGKLENLVVLKLKILAFKGPLWDTEEGGFQRLINLFIGETDLMHWAKASANHFPELNTLVLNNCSQLQGLPEGFEDIPSLKSLVLYYTSSNVASDGRKLQALKQKQAEKKGKNNTLMLSVYPAQS